MRLVRPCLYWQTHEAMHGLQSLLLPVAKGPEGNTFETRHCAAHLLSLFGFLSIFVSTSCLHPIYILSSSCHPIFGHCESWHCCIASPPWLFSARCWKAGAACRWETVPASTASSHIENTPIPITSKEYACMFGLRTYSMHETLCIMGGSYRLVCGHSSAIKIAIDKQSFECQGERHKAGGKSFEYEHHFLYGSAGFLLFEVVGHSSGCCECLQGSAVPVDNVYVKFHIGPPRSCPSRLLHVSCSLGLFMSLHVFSCHFMSLHLFLSVFSSFFGGIVLSSLCLLVFFSHFVSLCRLRFFKDQLLTQAEALL